MTRLEFLQYQSPKYLPSHAKWTSIKTVLETKQFITLGTSSALTHHEFTAINKYISERIDTIKYFSGGSSVQNTLPAVFQMQVH